MNQDAKSEKLQHTLTNVDVENAPEEQPAESNEEREYPHGIKLFLTIMAAMVSVFLVALDRLIIATAVPKITDQFDSLKDVGWYASSYLITSCATQLLWGRIYTFYSTKTVFSTAIGIFEVGSLLCGVAPNSNAFITGRAIAGMGSSGIFSGTTLIIVHVIPLHKRPAYMGAMGSVFGVSSIVGPLLGGAFADKATWRWCFYINLPLGAVAVSILLFTLHFSSSTKSVSIKQQIAQLDPIGTVVFLPGIVCLLLALQWGGSEYAWNDERVIALFVLAGVLVIAFIIVQIWQQENATIPPRLTRYRSVSCGALYSLCIGGAMISLVYFLPLWFQAIKGTTAVRSGINTLPMVLSLVVGAIGSGATIRRTGWYNPWMFFSTILMSIGSGLITTFEINTEPAKWIGYQVIFGLGLGTGMQQSSLAAQTILAQKDVSMGISIMFFAQSLGGALFICVAQSLFTTHLVSGLSHISGIDPRALLTAGATEVRSVVAQENLGAVLWSYNEALSKAFIVALAVSCFSVLPALGMEWKKIEKRH